jgi:hypothetical protein
MISKSPCRCAVVDVGVVTEGEDSRILYSTREEVPGPTYGLLLPCVDVMPVKTMDEHDAESVD